MAKHGTFPDETGAGKKAQDASANEEGRKQAADDAASAKAEGNEDSLKRETQREASYLKRYHKDIGQTWDPASTRGPTDAEHLELVKQQMNSGQSQEAPPANPTPPKDEP